MIELAHSSASRVFYYFQEISKIPHGSGNTKQISDYCVNFAKEHGLTYYQDNLNNIIIIREATSGYEDHKPYIIQGHLDMVCEKNQGVEIDFEKDGLDLYIEDGFIKARGTTLGADDGIAIAYGLALLEMKELKSPRLEVVFTVDEETGMYGAEAIDLSMLQGTDWLNLDSSEEGVFLCGCAGGVNTSIEFPLEYKNVHGHSYVLKLFDFEGGHSGDKIHEGHGNPTLLIGRIMQDLDARFDIALVNVTGGRKGNAIPRDSEVTFIGDAGQKEQIVQAIEDWKATFLDEYAAIDPDMKLSLEIGEAGIYRSVTKSVQTQMISVLVLLPDGVITMSKEFPGHVESSTNAGVCCTTEEKFFIRSFVRSNVYSKKRMIADKIKCLATALGGIYNEKDDYPAWEYKKESTLRNNLLAVYRDLYKEEPKMDIIHAGLECGLFQQKVKNLDCVAFGPNTHSIHTPKERMEIASVERVWEFLLKLLAHGNRC
ncbi:MAG: aminoacyl-histidine dipeptidase [Eubacterium sp.]|nr:aminoacyl-histidine dipeptidase [Eubacterium sp.]